MTTTLKNRLERTADKVAGSSTTMKIEGRSKELLGRVLEELGEWLHEPATRVRSEKQVEGRLPQEESLDVAREAALDTARRLKEIF